MACPIKEKIWEVTVEQIQGKPSTRMTVEMDTCELISRLIEDWGDHIVDIKNLKG